MSLRLYAVTTLAAYAGFALVRNPKKEKNHLKKKEFGPVACRVWFFENIAGHAFPLVRLRGSPHGTSKVLWGFGA